jgi:hypothetical protein
MKLNKIVSLASLMFASVATIAYSQTPVFTPGKLAVLQEGTGGIGRCLPLGSGGSGGPLTTNYSVDDIMGSRQTPLFIDQFDPMGVNQTVPSYQVAIPTNGPGAMMVNGNAGTEGGLTLSGDRSVLTFAGYQGDILSITTGSQTAPSNLSYDRGIGTVDAFGNYANPYRGGAWYGIATGKTNPRGVATDGLGHFWGCGNGYGSLYFDATVPGFQPIQFQNIALTSCSKVINGRLYASIKQSESVNLYPAGVYSFVDFYNNPVNYPSSASFLHLEIPATAPYTTCIGYEINPQNTIAYLADTTYGVQKYVKSGLAWKLAYNIAIPGYIDANSRTNFYNNPNSATNFVGAFSIAVDWSGTNPVVYATTSDCGQDSKDPYYGNRVVRINDTNTVVNGLSLTNFSIVNTVVHTPLDANGLFTTNIVYKSVTFTPDLRPVITNNPVSWSAVVNDNVSFNVGAYSSASGGSLSYQWLQNGTNLTGQTSDTLTLNSVQLSLNNFAYKCVVNNNYGSVTSSVASLTVASSATLPVIGTVQNITNYVGNNQSITAIVGGTDPKGGYQWYLNGVALTDGTTSSGSTLSGTATSTLTIIQAGTNDQGAYSITVTNVAGPASNTVANFYTVYSAPVIVQSPAPLTTFVGVGVTNTAASAGALLTEQWYGSYVAFYTNTVTSTNAFTNGVLQVKGSAKAVVTAFALNGYVTNALSDGAKYSGSTSAALALLNPQIADTIPALLASSLSTNGSSKTTYTTNSGIITTNVLATTNVVTVLSSNLLGNFSIVFSNPGGSVTSSPALLTVLTQPSHAFLKYTNLGSIYTQNFNSLPVNGGSSADAANPNGIQTETNFTVIDLTTGGPLNTYSLNNPFDFTYPIIAQGKIGGLGLAGTMDGWYAWASGTMQFGATYGDQSAGGIIDNGQNYTAPGVPLAGITNRALGMISTTKSGYTAFGLGIVNQTTNTLARVNLSFIGELWRNNPNQQVVGFSYGVDTAGTASTFSPGTPDGNITSPWSSQPVSIHGLDIVFPTNSATSINDGTQSTNQVSLSTNSLPVSGWTPGSTLWLVWQSQNPAGGAQAVAIDNVSFSATPAPVTVTQPVMGSTSYVRSGANAGLNFNFSNTPGASWQFTVWGTTNIALPLNQWQNLGNPVEVSSGVYQFNDKAATNTPSRFYRVTAVTQ